MNRTVARVETDSRTIHAGSLFIPLSGERFDGHAYINSALEGGAAGCFTQRERESYLPGKFYIKVDSTQRALRDLAKYYKAKFPIPVIAITGSVGKTTTKDMVAAVLGEKYNVLKTEGNLNNEIGVPMTLLRLKPEHQLAVLELGMNHAGEIDYLSALVEPDVVLMTTSGTPISSTSAPGEDPGGQERNLPPRQAGRSGCPQRGRPPAEHPAGQAALYLPAGGGGGGAG